MYKYFPGFVFHVPNGNHRKEHQSIKMESDSYLQQISQWICRIKFSKSIEKYNLRYVHYIGDGETASYKKIVDAKLYGDFTPQKLECVGHVQKTLGIRLRKLRNEKKHEILSDKFRKRKINRQVNE